MKRVIRFTSISTYLNEVRPLLELNEAANNLPLGLLLRSQNNDYKENYILLCVYENDKVVLTVQQANRAMIVTGNPQFLPELVEYLVEYDLKVNSLHGQPELVLSFAKLLTQHYKLTWNVNMNQRIYQINHVNDIVESPGEFRPATHRDHAIVLEYFIGFCEFIGEPKSIEEGSKLVKQHIEEATIFVWDDDGIVSIAKKARPTKNGIVINTVFTPESKRGNGYASSCVASLSRKLLEDYQFCSLYTDLSNPTSNNIYMQIGYTPVCDRSHIEINYSN